MRQVLLLTLCLALAACGTTGAVHSQCLPLKAYSSAEQKALAVELRALAAGSTLAEIVRDYEAMRDADRACLGGKPPDT